MNDDLPYLKQVSRLKHRILAHYLAPWAAILGSAHPRLRYVDCFAGGGRYVDEHGVPLDGSPVIALRTAQAYLRRNVSKHLALHFVESDSRTAQQLRDTLGSEEVLPNRLSVKVHEEGAEDFARKFLQVPRQRSTQIPTFIFIDPYGHPIPVPLIRTLLAFPRVEVFVNLMWYRINMDLSNQKSQENLNKLFGHTEWQSQSFLQHPPSKRERGFVDYLLKQIGNHHHAVRIPMPFSPEDQVPGGEQRTKYYLLHLSTHRKAALLMKDVMLKAREEELAGLTLPMWTPEQELESLLLERFGGSGTALSFDDIRLETLALPFREAIYRRVLTGLEKRGRVSITRVESKKTGLKGRDRIRFA